MPKQEPRKSIRDIASDMEERMNDPYYNPNKSTNELIEQSEALLAQLKSKDFAGVDSSHHTRSDARKFAAAVAANMATLHARLNY